MDSPGSDDERLRQEREAAPSKKMKILIIMLSLLLMILLLPLASNHGLPLLRPMGISLLQRLWDAMRFIAMTAAISVGIISTSNANNKNNKNSDSSSHYRSSSSSRRRSTTPIASSSREAINSNVANYSPNNITDRSSSFSPHAQHMPETENGDTDDIWNSIQTDSTQKYKGKEAMKDFLFSANSYSETHLDSADNTSASMQSQSRSFEGADYEGFKHRPLKLSMINSRRQWSAGDAWFLASRIDEDMEEDSTALSARYEFPSSRFHDVESSLSRADLQKASLASHDGKEGSNKENKTAHKGLMNNYNAMTDNNSAELRIRKINVTCLAEEYQDEKGKGQHRSSSVDRRRPMYIYDQKSPDQPGLKQILMEMSKERALKSKMFDSMAAGDQSHQRVREKPKHTHISSKPGALASSSSVKESMQANVQHHQASVVSTMKLLSDSNAIEKHADAKIIGINHMQQEAMKMGSTESFQGEIDAHKMGSNQRKHFPTSHEIAHKQAHTDYKMQPKEADHSQMRPTQKNVDASKLSNTQQNVHREGDCKAKVGSPRKPGDGKMASQTLNAGDSDQLSQMQNAIKLPLKGANIQSHHEGTQSLVQKGYVSSTSRLLKQSSQHSQSAMNLEQLGEADKRKQQTRPPVRSNSYDFGDGFNPDWLLDLEPPPPPGLLGGAKVEDEQSARGTYSSELVQSLVPWRSSAPITISAHPRAASPDLEALSTGPSSGEVNRRADEFISNFTTRLLRQKQESLERRLS